MYCLFHFQTVIFAPAISGVLLRYCLSHFQTVPRRPCYYRNVTQVLSVSVPNSSTLYYYYRYVVRYCLSHFQTVPVASSITGMLQSYCQPHFQTIQNRLCYHRYFARVLSVSFP